MASSASTHHRLSAAKPLKPEPQNPNPPMPTSTATTITTPKPKNPTLSRATYLTRSEVLKRRARHLRLLSKRYRDHYWLLMEELKAQYKTYYMKFGLSPFKDDDPETKFPNVNAVGVEGSGDNVNGGGGYSKCNFTGCKVKAMALTSYCHAHILSDPKQKLYKPCNYIIKSAQSGPQRCLKPILKSTVPSICAADFPKAQKHFTLAMKRVGHNVSPSTLANPDLHVMLKEFVRHIVTNRKPKVKAV
ncbi:hypothetical protein ACFE04_016182 [Oxalis oulophora]